MELIFLDIDGVLNSASGKGPYESDMEISKLLLLKKLIDETKTSGVVLTSDRRSSEIDTNNKIKVFNKYGIYIKGIIRNQNKEDFNDNRGKQIKDYLEDTILKIDKFIILDDNDYGISELFKDNFVLINSYFGFNEEYFKKALLLLK